MSANGRLGLLQMESEPDTRRCVIEKVEPQWGMDMRLCASKDAGPRRGRIVISHIDWGGERNILHKGVETSLTAIEISKRCSTIIKMVASKNCRKRKT